MCRLMPIVLALCVLLPGCRGADPPGEGPQPAGAAALQTTVDLDANDPTILKRPFTAEEIRAEMIEGFEVVVRRSYPEDIRLERWTVVAADGLLMVSL